jgi:hypothetical protein
VVRSSGCGNGLLFRGQGVWPPSDPHKFTFVVAGDNRPCKRSDPQSNTKKLNIIGLQKAYPEFEFTSLRQQAGMQNALYLDPQACRPSNLFRAAEVHLDGADLTVTSSSPDTGSA